MDFASIATLNTNEKQEAIFQIMCTNDYNELGFSVYCGKARDLLLDWYDEANACPENGAILLSATLYIDSSAHPITGLGIASGVTFEDLMRAIEA